MNDNFFSIFFLKIFTLTLLFFITACHSSDRPVLPQIIIRAYPQGTFEWSLSNLNTAASSDGIFQFQISDCPPNTMISCYLQAYVVGANSVPPLMCETTTPGGALPYVSGNCTADGALTLNCQYSKTVPGNSYCPNGSNYIVYSYACVNGSPKYEYGISSQYLQILSGPC